MFKYDVKIGVAPTRRNLFSKEEALRLKAEVYQRLTQLGVHYIDIEDINGDGLLFGEGSVEKTVAKFKREEVDALFFPHVNFGTEDFVAKVAGALRKPVLLYGPRDGAPTPEGTRLTDSQCGLFATGKVLRRFQVPFNYLTNCAVGDAAFERGISTFTGVANMVKEFRSLRILQISTRPADFWTMMCNEGELLERFGIQISPLAMPELTALVKQLEADKPGEVLEVVDHIRANMEVCIPAEKVVTIAALKCAMSKLARERGCKAIAIQCWNALQGEIGIMPCAANGMLTDEGLPVVCETDIHGAITSVIAQAASMGRSPTFFADWTVRHPENDNGELLQHCGPFPISLAAGSKKLINPFCFPGFPGAVEQEIKKGDLTILRFDGDNGKYSLLAGGAKVIDGPCNSGSYCWIEVENWPRLERKLVEGPYVHHCVGIYEDLIPVLFEAERYLGFEMDFYDSNARERALSWLLGEGV